MVFRNLEKEFQFASKEALVDMALESVVELLDGCK